MKPIRSIWKSFRGKTTCIQYSLFICLSCLFAFNVSAQKGDDACSRWQYMMDTTSNLDFAQQESVKLYAKTDNECKAKILIVLAEIQSMRSDLDSAFYYLDRSISLSKKHHFSEPLAAAYFRKAKLLRFIGKDEESKRLMTLTRSVLNKFPKSKHWVGYYAEKAQAAAANNNLFDAISFSDSALVIATSLNDSLEIPDSYHNLGVYQYRLGNYEEAATQLLYSLQLKKEIEGSEIASTYFVLGACYSRWGQASTAEHYLKKAVKESKKDENVVISVRSLNALCSFYRKMGEIKKAEGAINESIKLAEEYFNSELTAEALLEQGRLFFRDKNDLSNARVSLNKSADIARDNHYTLTHFAAIEELISIAISENDQISANQLFPELRAINAELQLPEYNMRFLEQESDYFEVIGDTRLALDRYKQYINLKDSISSANVLEKIAFFERKYDLKDKEVTILKLNQENADERQATSNARSMQYVYLALSLGLLAFLFVGFLLYRKVRRQRTELAKLNQLKARMFSMISHDLRGMLIPFRRAGKIFNFYIDKKDFDKSLELSQELESNADKLSDFLENLLEWSLDQMEGYQLRPEQFDATAELKEIASVFVKQAEYKNVTVSFTSSGDSIIEFDKQAFHVIFRNLLSNSLKFTKNGTVELSYSGTETHFSLTVKDSGSGMSQSKIEGLLSDKRLSPTQSDEGNIGTGLGLQLVYNFVRMHKGEVHVESKLHEGTTFCLSFVR